MHFLSPHVLSTQKEPETTMGFTRQHNINSLIKSRRTTTTVAPSPSTPSTTTISNRKISTESIKWSKMHRPRDKFIYELLWKLIIQWQHARSRKYVSLILCTSKKIKGTPNANTVPSSRTYCTRRTIDTLCPCTQRCNRRRRTSCNCMPYMEMARSSIFGRIETDTIMSKRNGSSICMLQSEPLESTKSTR